MVKIDFEKWNFQIHPNILDLNPQGINSITHLLSTIGLNWAWLILSNPWWDIVGGDGSDDAAAAVAVAVGVGDPVAAVQVILCQKNLIFASINPKCDDSLFVELQVQYKKTTSSVHVVHIKSGSFLRRQLMIANYRVKKFARKSQ